MPSDLPRISQVAIAVFQPLWLVFGGKWREKRQQLAIQVIPSTVAWGSFQVFDGNVQYLGEISENHTWTLKLVSGYLVEGSGICRPCSISRQPNMKSFGRRLQVPRPLPSRQNVRCALDI